MNRILAVLKICIYVPFYFKNWFTAFLDIFKVLKLLNISEVLYVLNDGIKIYSRPFQYDIGIICEVFLWKVYSPRIPGFAIKKTDIVLDAGGYIGDFAIYSAKKATKGRVYTFEPVEENCDLIKKNIQINNLENIELFQNAITGIKENLVLKIPKNAFGSSSLYGPNTNDTIKKSIKTIGIKNFIKENKLKKIDVIKLDCEGAEYGIIYNLEKTFLQKTRNIIIEFHHYPDLKKVTYTPEKLIKYLESLNFQPYGEINKNKLSMMFFKNRNEK